MPGPPRALLPRPPARTGPVPGPRPHRGRCSRGRRPGRGRFPGLDAAAGAAPEAGGPEAGGASRSGSAPAGTACLSRALLPRPVARRPGVLRAPGPPPRGRPACRGRCSRSRWPGRRGCRARPGGRTLRRRGARGRARAGGDRVPGGAGPGAAAGLPRAAVCAVLPEGPPRQEWCKPACGNRARVARHHERRRADG
ncbi:CGNR zinc finger domain-containing protein [Streptomyces zhihengii]